MKKIGLAESFVVINNIFITFWIGLDYFTEWSLKGFLISIYCLLNITCFTLFLSEHSKK
jgi:hypothetical protein